MLSSFVKHTWTSPSFRMTALEICSIFPNKEQTLTSNIHHYIGCYSYPVCRLCRVVGSQIAVDMRFYVVSVALSPETIHRKSLVMTQECILVNATLLSQEWDSNLKMEKSPWWIGQRNREGFFTAVNCPGLIGLVSSWHGTKGAGILLRSTRMANLCG